MSIADRSKVFPFMYKVLRFGKWLQPFGQNVEFMWKFVDERYKFFRKVKFCRVRMEKSRSLFPERLIVPMVFRCLMLWNENLSMWLCWRFRTFIRLGSLVNISSIMALVRPTFSRPNCTRSVELIPSKPSTIPFPSISMFFINSHFRFLKFENKPCSIERITFLWRIIHVIVDHVRLWSKFSFVKVDIFKPLISVQLLVCSARTVHARKVLNHRITIIDVTCFPKGMNAC